MAQFGDVLGARVPFDRATGRHKHLGWVTFRDQGAIDRCLQKNDHFLEGNFVCIKLVSHCIKSVTIDLISPIILTIDCINVLSWTDDFIFCSDLR